MPACKRDVYARVCAGLSCLAAIVLQGCSLSLALDPPKKTAVAETPVPADSSVALLQRLLDSDDPQVRAQSALSLGEMGAQARPAVPALFKMVDDPDRHVRFASASAVARIAPEDGAAVPLLLAVAKDPKTSAEDRAKTVELLATCGPRGQEVAASLAGPHPTTLPTEGMAIISRPTTQPIKAAHEPQPEIRPTPIRATVPPATLPAAQANPVVAPAPAVEPPTTRPVEVIATAEPARRMQVEADPWSDIPGLTGLVTATSADLPPGPDIHLFGMRSYTSGEAMRVREWIARRPDLSEEEKQIRIKRFQEWKATQERQIYQKVLESR